MSRITNGELPQKRIPDVCVVLIGTNDLWAASFARPDAGEAPVLEEVEPLVQRSVWR